MKHYEALLILTPDLTEDKLPTVSDDIKKVLVAEQAADLVEIKIERRPLAYPIQRKAEGYYAIYNFTAPGAAIEKMRAGLRHKPEIMRIFFTERAPVPTGG